VRESTWIFLVTLCFVKKNGSLEDFKIAKKAIAKSLVKISRVFFLEKKISEMLI